MQKSLIAAVSLCVGLGLCAGSVVAQQPGQAPNFIREDAPVIALMHVSVIDGTGAAPQPDQTVVIDHGKITAVGASTKFAVPSGAKVIDATGKTVIPGIVGMHEHHILSLHRRWPAYRRRTIFLFPAAISRQRRNHRPHHRLNGSLRRHRS